MQSKPRVVVVFESTEEYTAYEEYAKAKGLNVKFFLKFAGRAYMNKNALYEAKKAKEVKSHGD